MDCGQHCETFVFSPVPSIVGFEIRFRKSSKGWSTMLISDNYHQHEDLVKRSGVGWLFSEHIHMAGLTDLGTATQPSQNVRNNR